MSVLIISNKLCGDNKHFQCACPENCGVARFKALALFDHKRHPNPSNDVLHWLWQRSECDAF